MKQVVSVNKWFVGICVLSLCFQLQSQDRSLNDIRARSVQAFGDIETSQGELLGTYLFYELNKPEQKKYHYAFEVLNQDLEVTGRKIFKSDNPLFLCDLDFNDRSYHLYILDQRALKLTSYVLDEAANLIKKSETTKKYKELPILNTVAHFKR